MISPRLNLQRFLLACGVGVSVQFMVSSLETLIFGDVIQTASADGERNLARTCEAAKRRALEIAPELLSLADWPLDDHLPAECVGVPDGRWLQSTMHCQKPSKSQMPRLLFLWWPQYLAKTYR